MDHKHPNPTPQRFLVSGELDGRGSHGRKLLDALFEFRLELFVPALKRLPDV